MHAVLLTFIYSTRMQIVVFETVVVHPGRLMGKMIESIPL